MMALTLTIDLRQFESSIRKTPDGWLWIGTVDKRSGYGRYGSPSNTAHRLAYEIYVGTIPTGYELDHVKKLCVAYGKLDVKVVPDEYGPAHVELVTRAENVLRRDGRKEGFCKYGHDTRITGRTAGGNCKECARNPPLELLKDW